MATAAPSTTGTWRGSPGTAKKDVARLLNDEGIIRNRAKVESAIKNAQAWLRIMEHGKGSFDDFLWKHVDHQDRS
jgi:3-methyladenine DNA glycosylase Tag